MDGSGCWTDRATEKPNNSIFACLYNLWIYHEKRDQILYYKNITILLPGFLIFSKKYLKFIFPNHEQNDGANKLCLS